MWLAQFIGEAGMAGKEYNESTSEPAQVVLTRSALIFSLSPEHRRQAQECLSKSGEIRFSFQELSVSNLGEIRDLSDGVQVD
jgi:hypothetical protein